MHKTHFTLLLVILLFVACEPEEITPRPPSEPIDEPISFADPKVGQESVYRFFEAIYDSNEGVDTVIYTRDSLWLTITGKAGNVYQMEARYTITQVVENYQFTYRDNSLILELSPLNFATHRLLAVKEETSEFPLGAIVTPQIPVNHQEYFYQNCVDGPCTGVRSNHRQMGKEYSQINVQANFAPTQNNRSGVYYFYNQGEGFVRIAYNIPWTDLEFGYDLILE